VTDVASVTAFRVGRVDALLHGTQWGFAWPGRNDRSRDSTLIACTYTAAVEIAEQLERMLQELDPLRREYERRRGDIAEWLEQQRREAETE
jgi:hypothetical protein